MLRARKSTRSTPARPNCQRNFSRHWAVSQRIERQIDGPTHNVAGIAGAEERHKEIRAFTDTVRRPKSARNPRNGGYSPPFWRRRPDRRGPASSSRPPESACPPRGVTSPCRTSLARMTGEPRLFRKLRTESRRKCGEYCAIGQRRRAKDGPIESQGGVETDSVEPLERIIDGLGAFDGRHACATGPARRLPGRPVLTL